LVGQLLFLGKKKTQNHQKRFISQTQIQFLHFRKREKYSILGNESAERIVEINVNTLLVKRLKAQN